MRYADVSWSSSSNEVCLVRLASLKLFIDCYTRAKNFPNTFKDSGYNFLCSKPQKIRKILIVRYSDFKSNSGPTNKTHCVTSKQCLWL